MINKRKVVVTSLLTALIMTLVFANLNVIPIAAEIGAGAGTGNPGTTITFDSGVTMEFETGNTTWISSGIWMECFNDTKGENITEIANGTKLSAKARPGWEFVAPEPETWWYIYTEQLYGMCISFQVDHVEKIGELYHFNVSEVYDFWYELPKNFTIDPPVTTFEVEQMIPTIKTGVNYMTFADFVGYQNPVNDSWYKITYPSEITNATFHINYTKHYSLEDGEDYYWVQFDELRNSTGQSVTTLDIPTRMGGTVDGIEGPQLITTLEQTEYYISSPACLLPEHSWWNITYPTEINTTQFYIDVSETKILGVFLRNYMHIGNVVGPADITLPGVEHIEAIWADAPNVAKIGSCDWFNVIEGVTPYTPTCWNITAPEVLKGVTFCVDIAGEGVFHIDEALDVPITQFEVANVTAEEFTPKIYIEESRIEVYPAWTLTFNVTIKTDYIFHAWGYEFTLEWNSSILTCDAVTNGELFAAATFMAGTPVMGKLPLTGAYFEYTEPPAHQVHAKPDNCTLAIVTFTFTPVDPGLVGLYDLAFGPETKLIGVTKDGNGTKYNAIERYIAGEIVDGKMLVKLPGDVNSDRSVTSDDLIFGLAPAYGSMPGDPNWNKQVDFDGNNAITSDDLIFGLAPNYGRSY